MAAITRTIHKIDATGKAVGRLASEIAPLLIGKHKPSFMPNVDGGDIVEVSNASKMTLTGKKIEQKAYYHHTGYRKGLKTKTLKELWETNPAEVLERAVSRMLPKNTHRTPRLKRLRITN